MVTVITLYVYIVLEVLATSTGSTSVVRTIVLGLDHKITATTFHALFIPIAVSVIITERKSVHRAVASVPVAWVRCTMVSGHRMATAIIIHVHTDKKEGTCYTP